MSDNSKCIRTSEGGREVNFLRGGGMDVFWNDPFVAGIPQSAKMKNSHTSTLSSLPGGVYSIYI